MPGKDIFLSYASEDRDRILPLVRALEGTGWSVFWDRTIPIGKTWRQVITEELTGCRSMVVAWSRVSVEKEWVLSEAERGKKRKILYPVCIDRDVELPLVFDQIQTTDLVGWDGSPSAPPVEQLVKGLSSLLGTPPADAERDRREQEKVARRIEEIRQRAQEADRKAQWEVRQRLVSEQATRKAEAERRRQADKPAHKGREEGGRLQKPEVAPWILEGLREVAVARKVALRQADGEAPRKEKEETERIRAKKEADPRADEERSRMAAVAWAGAAAGPERSVRDQVVDAASRQGTERTLLKVQLACLLTMQGLWVLGQLGVLSFLQVLSTLLQLALLVVGLLMAALATAPHRSRMLVQGIVAPIGLGLFYVGVAWNIRADLLRPVATLLYLGCLSALLLNGYSTLRRLRLS